MYYPWGSPSPIGKRGDGDRPLPLPIVASQRLRTESTDQPPITSGEGRWQREAAQRAQASDIMLDASIGSTAPAASSPDNWPWNLDRGVRPALQDVMTSDLQDAKGCSTANRVPKGHARPPSAGTPDMLGGLWLLYDRSVRF